MKKRYNCHTKPLFKISKIHTFKNLIVYLKLHPWLLKLSFSNFLSTLMASVSRTKKPTYPQMPAWGILTRSYVTMTTFLYPGTLCKIPIIWIPSIIVGQFSELGYNFFFISIPLFCRLLKDYFLVLLSENVVCGRLLCPTCHLGQIQ